VFCIPDTIYVILFDHYYDDMENPEEQELEKFIRDNKDKFDISEPESDHSEHFLNKLVKKFKEVIDIVPYLVKVGLATILIFILSFLIWKAFICPPLTHISLKYWKVEHDYRHQIHRNTRLAFNYIINPEEKAKFKSELQSFDNTFKILRKKLRKNPSAENIAFMLKFYQDELLRLEENVQNYTNQNRQNK
jgi:hypothetical protein